MAVKKATVKKAVTAKKAPAKKASKAKSVTTAKKAAPAKKAVKKQAAPEAEAKKETTVAPVKKETLIKGLTPEELADICVATADDRKAVDIKKIKVSAEGALSDYFVICTGNSEPHIRAIAEKIERELRNNKGIRPRATEGTAASKWIVIDYFAVVVHVLTPEMRDNYRLEDLWENPETVKKTATKKATVPKKSVAKKTKTTKKN